MDTLNLNFNIFALAQPKSRQDCIAVTNEILAELSVIEGHIDAAIARLESKDACATISA